jgi:release factor glutamine methyltransferase
VSSVADLPAEVREWEPSAALLAGEDGLDDLRVIVAGAGEWLEPEGVLVCEISPEQAGAVGELAARYFAEVRVEPDLTDRPRTLVARWVIGDARRGAEARHDLPPM